MDLQDHTIPSGHGVHLCHRCGWPFPNPHPSAKHRRSHKKICGTIQGYTTLISGSEVVSDDEQEKTPSPKNSDVIRSRSEDEMFSDAVTEFSDSAGSVNKTLDKDVFFSFKDAENDGTNNAPKKLDASLEVSEKQNPLVEKTGETEITTECDSSESKVELTDTNAQPSDDLVKDGFVEPRPEPIYVSQSQEVKSIEVVEAGEGKSQESRTFETITEEAKDSEISKMTPEVSETVGGNDDNIKLENFEKLESAKEDVISDEIKQEIVTDCEPVSEVVKDSETVEGVSEEIKHEKIELDHEHAPEAANKSEIDQNVSVLTEKVDLDAPKEQGQVVVKEPDTGLTEKEDLELEKCSKEQIQQVVEEPDTVLTEKEDLGEPILEKGSNEHVHQVVEKPDSILTEKENLDAPELEKCSEEQIQEVVKEPDTVLTEKEDLGEPKQLNEHIYEVVEKPDSVLTQKQDLDVPAILEKSSKESQPDSNLIEKEDLGAPKSENCLKEDAQEVTETKVDDVSNDVSVETITLKDSSDNSIDNTKNVPEAVVEEGNEKLISNQDCSVDSSSRNSLDANWGSVSVLSAASVDAETLEKSKVNSLKSTAADSHSGTSDVYEAPSFMTLVKPEVKDEKSGSSEAQDSQQQPNPESSQAGWFPTLTKVNNESEGRKRNEEVIAKVTNWSTGKQSTPLKNLLGEAKSPSGKQQTEPMVVEKDEGANGQTPVVNHDVSSPPKLIEDGKKGKKVKGRSSWVPFVCCSSVNVVN